MELQKFIENFAAQFEEIDVPNINADVDFKTLETWDSLTAMSVQVMIEDEYKVDVSPADFKNAVSVLDLFNFVKSKKG